MPRKSSNLVKSNQPHYLLEQKRKRRRKFDESRREKRQMANKYKSLAGATRISEQIQKTIDFCKFSEPLFILSKSFMVGAGIGVIANWKYSEFPVGLKLPFIDMEYVEFFPWDVSNFVIGQIQSSLMDPSNNYRTFMKYREKHTPKMVWRPKRFQLRSSHQFYACGQFVNHPLPKETPDAEAIVPSTGQDLRITNCEIVVSAKAEIPPYVKPLENGIAIKPGHELIAGYSAGFRRIQAVAEQQVNDHKSWSKVLSANLPNVIGDPETDSEQKKDCFTRVQKQQEAQQLREEWDTIRLKSVRDCPSELLNAPLISSEHYQWLLALLEWKRQEKEKRKILGRHFVRSSPPVEPGLEAEEVTTNTDTLCVTTFLLEDRLWRGYLTNVTSRMSANTPGTIKRFTAMCSRYLDRQPRSIVGPRSSCTLSLHCLRSFLSSCVWCLPCALFCARYEETWHASSDTSVYGERVDGKRFLLQLWSTIPSSR